MEGKITVIRKEIVYTVPLSLAIALVLSAAGPGGLSMLWVIGTLSMAGSMLLVLSDGSLGRRWSVVIFFFQVLVLFVSSLMPERIDEMLLSPRLIIYGMGTAVAMCASMVVNLVSKCGDSDFLFGEYRGKNFVLDSMRVVYSMVQITVLLMVTVTFWADAKIRLVVNVLCLVASFILFVLIQLRFHALYVIEKTSENNSDPTDVELALYRQVVEVLEGQKLFLDPALTMDDICRQLGSNRSYTSKCINNCTGMTVPRFINNYRVRYAMELFRQNPKLKVAELSILSGFGNGITFATAFRLETNMNPRDWCRDVRDELSIERKRLSRKKVPEPEPEPEPLSPDEGG